MIRYRLALRDLGAPPATALIAKVRFVGQLDGGLPVIADCAAVCPAGGATEQFIVLAGWEAIAAVDLYATHPLLLVSLEPVLLEAAKTERPQADKAAN